MKHFHNGIHRKSRHERLVPTKTRRFRQARITLATRNTQESFNSNYESASGREIPQQLPMATLTQISLGRFRRTKEGHRIPMPKPHIHLNPMAPAARPKLSLGRFRPNMSMDRTVQTSRRTQQPSWLFSWSAPAYATFILVRPGVGSHSCRFTIFVLFTGLFISSI